jgi:hypothetical protein
VLPTVQSCSADEAVDAGVVAVGDEGGAVESFVGASSDLCGDLVSGEPDDTGGGEPP